MRDNAHWTLSNANGKRHPPLAAAARFRDSGGHWPALTFALLQAVEELRTL